MATIQDLGKVAYLNKGNYDENTNYEINDVVSYNGSSYVSLVNDNKGNIPTNINFWSVVAQSAYDIYVKNGGTLTEAEWLDAFLNADNYYTKNEVKGLTIDNLESNLTDQPLSANQGRILKEILDTSKKEIKASNLGLLETNDETIAENNFNLLKEGIESGLNILIDGSYFIKNTDIENSISINKNVYIKGLDKTCNLKNFDNHYLYFFNHNNYDIHLDNVNYINNYSYESYFIYDIEENNIKKQYGNITIENSYFEGNIAIIHIRNAEATTRDETWGLNNIKFINNHVYNNGFTAIRISNTPYGVFDIIGNVIHNFAYSFCRTYPSNTESTSTGQEFLKCINAFENLVYNDDDFFSNDGTYACFIETKSNTAIVKNNTIKGIKSNNSNVAVYSCYLSCLKTVFENNICENIVNLASSELNYCMKAKDGNGYRLYRNNKFILNKDWVYSINETLENPYSESDLLANTTYAIYHSDHEQIEWKIEDNYFDLINVHNYQRYRDIQYCYFNNNIVNCEKLTGRLFYPTENTKIVECCNNTFNIKGTASGSAALCYIENRDTSCDIKINNNKINGVPSNLELCSLAETGIVNDIELLDNTYLLDTVTDLASYNRFLLIRGKYNNLKVNNYLNFVNALNINRVKINPNKICIDETIVFGTFNPQQEIFDIDKTQEYNGKYLMKLKYYNDNNEKITQYSIFEMYKEDDTQYIKFTNNSGNEVTENITTTPESTVLQDLKNYSGTTSNIQFRHNTSVLYIRLNGINLTKNKMIKIHFEKIA